MQVVLSRSAADYLRKETIYLKIRNPHAATVFSQRIREAMRKLEGFPDLGAHALPIPGARTLVMGDYLLDYHHDGKTIFVLAIRHGRMRPPGEFPASDDEADFDA